MKKKWAQILSLGIMLITISVVGNAKEASNPWRELFQFNINHPTDYAGFLNEQFGITVGFAGEIHYTNDSGKTWPQAENSSMCRYGLDIVNEKVAWSCGNKGHIRLSTDSGKTWQPVTSYQITHLISFSDATHGWTANTTYLGATEDGGKTWQDLNLPKGCQAISAIRVISPKTGYLLDSGGKLYFTKDWGCTWSVKSIGLDKNVNIVDINGAKAATMRFKDTEHGIVVCALSNSKVIAAVTADGGKTWTKEIVPGLSPIQHFFLAPDGKTLTVTEYPLIKVLRRE